MTTGPAGIAACDTYLTAVERFAACAAAPLDARTALRDAGAAMAPIWARARTGAVDERQTAADDCAEATARLGDLRDAFGCR